MSVRLTVVHSYSKKMLESGDNQTKKKIQLRKLYYVKKNLTQHGSSYCCIKTIVDHCRSTPRLKLCQPGAPAAAGQQPLRPDGMPTSLGSSRLVQSGRGGGGAAAGGGQQPRLEFVVRDPIIPLAPEAWDNLRTPPPSQ